MLTKLLERLETRIEKSQMDAVEKQSISLAAINLNEMRSSSKSRVLQLLIASNGKKCEKRCFGALVAMVSSSVPLKVPRLERGINLVVIHRPTGLGFFTGHPQFSRKILSRVHTIEFRVEKSHTTCASAADPRHLSSVTSHLPTGKTSDFIEQRKGPSGPGPVFHESEAQYGTVGNVHCEGLRPVGPYAGYGPCKLS
ncbi:hypothetical protein TcasGA2_TC004787 [Tribolium castaneum]|uniref:Uncharacterized protein n=1 Tax=Tribolium castaneum TaxID=7070 RepID=D6W842_TRICA|nr:hypothetical protein TcasGA2_TC004787 [Tribolium castaneum]